MAGNPLEGISCLIFVCKVQKWYFIQFNCVSYINTFVFLDSGIVSNYVLLIYCINRNHHTKIITLQLSFTKIMTVHEKINYSCTYVIRLLSSWSLITYCLNIVYQYIYFQVLIATANNQKCNGIFQSYTAYIRWNKWY